MWEYLKIYGVALIIFFAIDMLWLGVIAKNLYDRFIGELLGDVKWLPAIIFYLLFIVGLTFFVIEPAIAKESLTHALFAGMFFGFITYATYDLTNLATLEGWSLEITIIDLVWGSVLGGSVSLFTYLILG